MDATVTDPNADWTGATEFAHEVEADERPPVEDVSMAGQGGSPPLALEGFSGPLARLLTLARARQVNLARLSLTALVDQLAVALQQAPPATPLGQKGDWVVMAAWLLQLRSLLLLPAEAPARQAAEVEVDQLRARLIELRAMQTLAGWLQQRPQLGHDVFARGHPPSRAQSPVRFGIAFETPPALDIIEFLWASLALFDDQPDPDTAPVYRPRRVELYGVAEARQRILRLLAERPHGGALDQFLPEPQAVSESGSQQALRRRSGWASTFIASLELAKHGDVVLGQGRDFQTIQVRPAPTNGCNSGSEQDSRSC